MTSISTARLGAHHLTGFCAALLLFVGPSGLTRGGEKAAQQELKKLQGQAERLPMKLNACRLRLQPDCYLGMVEKVVWRIRVLDPAGQEVDGKGLRSLVVELPDGQKLDAKFGPHPPPSQGPSKAMGRLWPRIH